MMFTPLDPRSSPDAPTEHRPAGFAAEPIDVTVTDTDTWRDQTALALVRVAREEANQVVGVWAAWRRVGLPGADYLAKAFRTKVFLIEVTSRADLPGLIRRLQPELTAIDGPESLVEVFTTGDRLLEHQRLALGSAALVWARPGSAVPEQVTVFDSIDARHGPQFAADHPRLSADERVAVARYLYSADAVLRTTATMPDVMAPCGRKMVPLSYRTDGSFIWSEAVAYYADRYGLAPFSPLLEAIRRAGYRPPRPDGVARFRAEAVVLQSGL
jgi:hypothetical protein